MRWLAIWFGTASVLWAFVWFFARCVTPLRLGHPVRKVGVWVFLGVLWCLFRQQLRLCYLVHDWPPRLTTLEVLLIDTPPMFAILYHFARKQQARLDEGEVKLDDPDPITLHSPGRTVETADQPSSGIDPEKRSRARRILYAALLAALLVEVAFMLIPVSARCPITRPTRLFLLLLLLHGGTYLQSWLKTKRKTTSTGAHLATPGL